MGRTEVASRVGDKPSVATRLLGWSLMVEKLNHGVAPGSVIGFSKIKCLRSVTSGLWRSSCWVCF